MNKKSSQEIVTYILPLIPSNQEMENMYDHKDRMIRENNRQLEHAKSVGYACEDMATDVKINLAGQSDKMQNSVLKNLHSIQGETTVANRVMNLIKKERMKNRIILYSVILLLVIAIVFITIFR